MTQILLHSVIYSIEFLVVATKFLAVVTKS